MIMDNKQRHIVQPNVLSLLALFDLKSTQEKLLSIIPILLHYACTMLDLYCIGIDIVMLRLQHSLIMQAQEVASEEVERESDHGLSSRPKNAQHFQYVLTRAGRCEGIRCQCCSTGPWVSNGGCKQVGLWSVNLGTWLSYAIVDSCTGYML